MERTLFARTFFLGFAAMSVSMAVNMAPASAQLDNRPYSFSNSSGGGPGMSTAGKQAIINKELFGRTPDNLVRSPDGSLLDVREGPGNTAFVSRPGTTDFIPGYRGRSFREGAGAMSVGVFNSFFEPDRNGSSSAVFMSAGSGVEINTWTSRVMAGPAALFFGGGTAGSIDAWTGAVHNLASVRKSL